ncbi:hypothetical protein TGFOU_203815 [Toxoplasma gondii FOU]|uniref:Transmembrane protein n=2 Tax=Toxoplasma gondii TaxID=5811 RepID=A0A086K4X7_TOXGO|nr:hypothetical protein TGFOU_203815 [Toxoplasma gondii FOU]
MPVTSLATGSRLRRRRGGQANSAQELSNHRHALIIIVVYTDAWLWYMVSVIVVHRKIRAPAALFCFGNSKSDVSRNVCWIISYELLLSGIHSIHTDGYLWPMVTQKSANNFWPSNPPTALDSRAINSRSRRPTYTLVAPSRKTRDFFERPRK